MALGTVPQPEGVAKPTLDELVKHTNGNQYALAMFAATRARQINAYFNQLNEGLLQNVGPLVEYDAKEKPLSIAFREINEGLLEQTLASNNESDKAKEQETAAELKDEMDEKAHAPQEAADEQEGSLSAGERSDFGDQPDPEHLDEQKDASGASDVSDSSDASQD